MDISNNKEFPADVYHVTWVAHNSRVAGRSRSRYTVKDVHFNEDTEIIITSIIAEKHYTVYAYNICRDHIHLLIKCDAKELANAVRTIKGKTAQLYKESLKIPADQVFHLWGQKYNKWRIDSKAQFNNTIEYIKKNRRKHGIAENKDLYPYIRSMLDVSND